jgi:hypothetical protein
MRAGCALSPIHPAGSRSARCAHLNHACQLSSNFACASSSVGETPWPRMPGGLPGTPCIDQIQVSGSSRSLRAPCSRCSQSSSRHSRRCSPCSFLRRKKPRRWNGTSEASLPSTLTPPRAARICIIDHERELNKPTSRRRTRRSVETSACDLSAELKRADSATGSWSAGCRNSPRSG